MATRNLTDSFVQLRAKSSRAPSEPRGRTASGGTRSLLEDVPLSNREAALNPLGDLEGGGGGGASVASMLPPAWVDSVDQVERDLGNIDTQLESLRELHRKRLMVTFDADEAAQDSEIEGNAKQITVTFRKAEKALKKISDVTSFTDDDQGSQQAEQKLRANIVRTLASRLQQSSVTFRRAQKDFLTRRAEQKGGSAGGFDFLGLGDGAAAEKGGGGGGGLSLLPTVVAGEGMTMQQLEVVGDIESEVAQRDHEINSIVESIEELSVIFKELAVLVIDQGTILDRIDYNMEQVVEKVEDGVVQLEKAEEYQKSARPRNCICVLMVLIAVMMTMLILKNQPKKKKNGEDDDELDDAAAVDDQSSAESSVIPVRRMLRAVAQVL